MSTEKSKIEKPQKQQPEGKSPISEGEMFFPGLELKDIKELPSKERKEALEKWKEKYIYQKEGFAKMQEDFVSQIRENPDISLEDLNKNLEVWGAKYGFTPQQKKIAETILQEYEQKHQAVRKYRKEYPDDVELFEKVFGAKPHGKVEVLEGPMTLYFKCHDLEDYALIHSGVFMYKRSISAEDIEMAKHSGGVSIRASLMPELSGTIVAKKVKVIDKKQDDKTDKILIHEEQHAIKRLFTEISTREKFALNIVTNLARGGENAGVVIAEFMRPLREEIEWFVKDEILAYCKAIYEPETELEIKKAVLEIIFKKLDYVNHTKSYLYYYTNEIRKNINKIFEGETEFGRAIYETLNLLNNEELRKKIIESYKKADKQVFEDEYKQIVWEGLNVYKALRDSGYSQEQTIALLINEPLIKWPKVASRLLGKFDVVKMKD